MTDRFKQSMIDWCHKHPEDPTSMHLLKDLQEQENDAEKRRLIAKALEEISR